ncbi:hypothetical protein QLX08_001635 [Tetragonisca angustula]|uniref:Uncharacterized protein n=1 Tax=Tetragonisca angustula TaxID=166442 RepID=A0AAW1AEG1_9HYME
MYQPLSRDDSGRIGAAPYPDDVLQLPLSSTGFSKAASRFTGPLEERARRSTEGNPGLERVEVYFRTGDLFQDLGFFRRR